MPKLFSSFKKLKSGKRVEQRPARTKYKPKRRATFKIKRGKR